jgi:hypothetical protein
VKTVGLCVGDYMYTLRGIDKSSDIYFDTRKMIHSRCAKRIYNLSINNRGIYYKAG